MNNTTAAGLSNLIEKGREREHGQRSTGHKSRSCRNRPSIAGLFGGMRMHKN
ncbi:MAG TPA: hypothetical protein VEM40_05310 [Nitrospirota bacterium]|nr:hypothetical protein [Nitrospirota bacterium]